MSQKTPAELRKLNPSIYNYDLKYASKVIQGDPDVLNLIPEMDPSKLPLKEGKTLFFTRLWTLLGSLDEKGFGLIGMVKNLVFFEIKWLRHCLQLLISFYCKEVLITRVIRKGLSESWNFIQRRMISVNLQIGH
jgi:hypothetical protein